MLELFDTTSFEISRIATRQYSTSFYVSTCLLPKVQRRAIFSIYGFVRFADEIVDTFHAFDKEKLLERFEADMKEALQNRISLNPILHAFQHTVHQFNISYELIHSFLNSMKMDLTKKVYTTRHETETYIYGSANVVGLMCLKVFCDGDEAKYNALKHPAMMLGSAFQKVNFFRDLHCDIQQLDRKYFHEYDLSHFNENDKNKLVREIELEFLEAKKGIAQLPDSSKVAVLTAYYYYFYLLHKIASTPAPLILQTRIRITTFEKTILLAKAMLAYTFNRI